MVARIVKVTFLRKFTRKFKRQISKFEVFSLVSFFCFFCGHYFSFALLTITRARKRQRTSLNNVSNINKTKTMTL